MYNKNMHKIIRSNKDFAYKQSLLAKIFLFYTIIIYASQHTMP